MLLPRQEGHNRLDANGNTRQLTLTARLWGGRYVFVWAKGGRAGMPGLRLWANNDR